MSSIRSRVWVWASSLVNDRILPKVKQTAFAAASKAQEGTVAAMRPVVAEYERRKAKTKAFLEDQGFVFDCLPDPPGYEPKYLIKRNLPWSKHREIWVEAWRLYKQSWKEDVWDQHKLPPAKVEGDKDKADDIKSSLKELRETLGFNAKRDTKEDVAKAMAEFKEAVRDAAPDAKAAVQNLKESAKEKFKIYRETVQAFLEGYRETINFHEEEDRARSNPPATRPHGNQNVAGQHGQSKGEAQKLVVIRGAFVERSASEKHASNQ